MKRKKVLGRFLSVFLSVAMVFTMLPVSAMAAPESGEEQYASETAEQPDEETREAAVEEPGDKKENAIAESDAGSGEAAETPESVLSEELTKEPDETADEQDGGMSVELEEMQEGATEGDASIKFVSGYDAGSVDAARINDAKVLPQRSSGSKAQYCFQVLDDSEGTIDSGKVKKLESSNESVLKIEEGDSVTWIADALEEGTATITVEAVVGEGTVSEKKYSGSLALTVKVLPDGLEPVIIRGTTTVGQKLTCTPGYGIPEGTYSYQWWRSDKNYNLTDEDIQMISGATDSAYVLAEEDFGKCVGCTVKIGENSWRREVPVGPIIQENRIPLWQGDIEKYADKLATAYDWNDKDTWITYGSDTDNRDGFMLMEDITLTKDLVIVREINISFLGHTMNVPDSASFKVACPEGETGGPCVYLVNDMLEFRGEAQGDGTGVFVGKLQVDGRSQMEIQSMDFRKTDWSECHASNIMTLSGNQFDFDPWNPLDPKFPADARFFAQFGTVDETVLADGTKEYATSGWTDPEKLKKRYTVIEGEPVSGEELTAKAGQFTPYELKDDNPDKKTWHYEWRRLDKNEAKNYIGEGHGVMMNAAYARMGTKVGKTAAYKLSQADLGRYLVVDIIADDGTIGWAGRDVVGPVGVANDSLPFIPAGETIVGEIESGDDKFIDENGKPSNTVKLDMGSIAQGTAVSGLEEFFYTDEKVAGTAEEMIKEIQASDADALKDIIGADRLYSFEYITGIDLGAADFDPSKLNVVIQPAVKVTPVSCSYVSGSQKFALDIRTVLRTVIAKEGVKRSEVKMGDVSSPNAMAVGEPREIETGVSVPVNVTVPLYSAFFQDWKQAAIKHTHGTAEYQYVGKVTMDGYHPVVSFISEQGLSQFEIAQSDGVAVMVAGKAYAASETELAVQAAMENDAVLTLYADLSVTVNREGTLRVKENGYKCTVKAGEGFEVKGDAEIDNTGCLVYKIVRTEFTVTFDLQGKGTAIPSAMTSGGKVTKPADPVAEGFTFGGWYKEAACENAWNFDTDVAAADVTLYAKWTAVEPVEKIFTVKYNMMGHGAQIADSTVKNGEKLTAPAKPAAEGFTFGGWYKEQTYVTAWNFDTDTVTADITLYAKWTENANAGDPGTPPEGGSEYIKPGETAIPVNTIILSASVTGKNVFNGNPIEAKVKITASKKLIPGTDYKITYANNINAGEAYALISGINQYSGMMKVPFTISPRKAKNLTIVSGSIMLEEEDGIPSAGDIADRITVYDSKRALEYGADYEIESIGISKGKVNFVIRGDKNYSTSCTKKGSLKITRPQEGKIDLEDCVIESISSVVYTGKAFKPQPVVTYGGETVDPKNYKVSYKNNVNVGIATVIVAGKKEAAGSAIVTFEILPDESAFIQADRITVNKGKPMIYTGKLLKPGVTITNTNGKKLKKGTDYLLYYRNELNAGTGEVIVVGIGNYDAGGTEITKNFTIDPIGFSKTKIAKSTDKKQCLFFNGKPLVSGVDFVVDVKPVSKGAVYTITLKSAADTNSKCNFTADKTKTIKGKAHQIDWKQLGLKDPSEN